MFLKELFEVGKVGINGIATLQIRNATLRGDGIPGGDESNWCSGDVGVYAGKGIPDYKKHIERFITFII